MFWFCVLSTFSAMMLLSELTGFSYGTFDYRKTHTTKGEILHHVQAYPQGKFNFITRRNECHSRMLCSSSLSAQTSPPHHLELVFYCIRVYIPPVEEWEKKVQAAFIFRTCESAMCARDNSTSFFVHEGRRATSHCDSIFKFVAFPLVRTLSDTHSF